ncbi:hypothetical protein NR800_37075 [Corallococcus interemptor]|uniref:hypothetical protein n=1 Tax=Corallococcus interemptor TaxID=2316720 RepID=UPI0035D49696
MPGAPATIITYAPDVMSGTEPLMTREGQAAGFIADDHATAECAGIHAAWVGTRFEALEPLRQDVKGRFDACGRVVAMGWALRHDNDSQYISEAFQDELRMLGAASSPSFVRSLRANSCAERFIRPLKEQLLCVRTFSTAERVPQPFIVNLAYTELN